MRSHDERLDAEINKIDLNRTEPGDSHINVIGVGGEQSDDATDSLTAEADRIAQYQLPGLVIDAFRAKVVEKVGDRQYWDRWAKDVADIATRIELRIETLIPSAGEAANGGNAQVRLHFDSLLESMRATTNNALTEGGAISIVAQHMITEPVFQTLFPDHDFAKSNPVANSLNQFVGFIKQHGLEAELESLDLFYASIRRRAEGLDNAEARRKVLEELYENFFKNALPKEAQRLGVVYTPHEIVDFILNSADYLLRKEFGKSLSEEGVHILDPFAGMGTFIWRLLANPDLIKNEDLERKFWSELHANEILPLAYYMASVNVEEAFRERIENREVQDPGYLPFEGMVWRDTFNAQTRGEGQQASIHFMQENDMRAKHQDTTDVRVIVANPPYSRGQTNANDDNQNVSYESMRHRIQQTYAARSRSSSKNILHDHYALACRWATDRLPKSGGIIGIVSNGSFLDSNAGSGLRACFVEEFSSIYAFNLRGNQRTQGETSLKEGGKVFGQGSRAPIAVIMFVKNPTKMNQKCAIYYKDIGDYLTRDEKLLAIKTASNVAGVDRWQRVTPDEHQDWIMQRDPSFRFHRAMGFKPRKTAVNEPSIFTDYALGTATNRDAWVYDFSKAELANRMRSTIVVYNSALRELRARGQAWLRDITRPDPKRIKWNDSLRKHLSKHTSVEFQEANIRRSAYRPFGAAWFYSDRVLVTAPNRQPTFYPHGDHANVSICVPAVGDRRGHSAMMTDMITDLHVFDGTQCFPRYLYRTEVSWPSAESVGFLDESANDPEIDYIRHDNIRDEVLTIYQSNYKDASITKDDIFYYVYGLLHSPLYKARYQNNLRRELPRIPMAPDFWAFSNSGRALSELHLNYEICEEFPLTVDGYLDGESPPPEELTLTSRRMRWTDKESKVAIRVNDHITVSGIPPEAHRYVVNGRTPLEWIIDRYHIKTDKASGIVHDPNKWFEETGDNIVSMIKRITYTSIETAKIIDTLPTPFTDGWTGD